MDLTADTITEAQIRELLAEAEEECRTPHVRTFSINFHPFSLQLISANWALGNFEDWYLDSAGHFHRVGGKYADHVKCMHNGRARCAEILNERTKAVF